MNAFIITIKDNSNSVQLANNCLDSIKQHNCNLSTTLYTATTPETLEDEFRLVFGKAWQDLWTYPWEGEGGKQGDWIDPVTKMNLSWYRTRVKEKRVACFLSHYKLWQACKNKQEPILILEHDAIFTKKFDYNEININDSYAVSINDPHGATFKSPKFHQMVIRHYKKKGTQCIDVPYVSPKQKPQGLPGNSAYILTPTGASKLLDNVSKVGVWPNDAIMCQQLMDHKLRVAYPYYTKIQRSTSTTTQ